MFVGQIRLKRVRRQKPRALKESQYKNNTSMFSNGFFDIIDICEQKRCFLLCWLYWVICNRIILHCLLPLDIVWCRLRSRRECSRRRPPLQFLQFLRRFIPVYSPAWCKFPHVINAYSLNSLKAVIIFEVYSFVQVFSVNVVRTKTTSYLPFRPSRGYMFYLLG